MKFALVVAMFVLLAFIGFAQSRTDANVIYGMYSGLALLGDIHRPEKPNGYGVVVVAGSAFSAPLSFNAAPLKDRVGDYTEALTGAGYLVFAINHRAAPRFTYPAAVEDVQRAVRYLRVNAAKYGIRPDRIGAMGGSSGGYLVAMAGTLDGRAEPNSTDPLLTVSGKVQAVVTLFAPFDLRLQFKDSELKGVPEALFVGAALTGAPNTAAESRLHAEASPIEHVSADDPPFLLFHGTEDTTVPISQSIAMRMALTKASVPVELITIEQGKHGLHFGFAPGDPRVAGYLDQVTRWLDKYLKN